MNWTCKRPKTGDIIRTKVSFYHHYGIFVNENEIIQFGLPDDPGRPAEEIFVLSTNIDVFLSCGGELEVAELNKNEKHKIRPAKEIIEIAKSKIGEGNYDILHNNCEHFVNRCAFGENESNFLNNVRSKLRKKLNLDN